jgi:quinol monooxygenase YgiN
MVSLVIDVRVSPGKFTEFSQTLDSLLQEFRLEEGCLSYVYKCQNTNPDQIVIEAEWRSWSQLERHFQGALFDIFLGAINILCERPHVEIKDQTRVLGMEAIEQTRKQKLF